MDGHGRQDLFALASPLGRAWAHPWGKAREWRLARFVRLYAHRSGRSPGAHGKTTFALHYRAFGIPRSAIVAFETARTDVRFVQSILEGLPSWVAFSKDPEPLLYFTTMLAYKFAIESIVWGMNEGPLERTVHFSSSKAPGIDPDDEIYVKLPAETSAVRVRVRYKDGTETAVRTFQRSAYTLR